MATTDSPVWAPRTAPRPKTEFGPRRILPINAWATVGALVLAFIAYVLINWITGPLFERVPVGPSDPPTAMKINMIFWQVVSIPAALALIYWYVVRPWRRARRIGADGLIMIGCCSLWFQDPLSAMGGVWFTYNSWLVNFGSWVNSVPGAMAPAAPGRMVVEPPLIIPALYVYFFFIGIQLGCWAMRRARRRWPRMSSPELFGVCLFTLFAFDIVFEGLIWMPGGIWEYPGGHVALLFGHSYHKYPLQEMLTAPLVIALVTSLRFFLNDRGEMLVERGSERLQGSAGRKVLIRALAVTGAVHLCMFVGYTLPNTWLGLHSTTWPADLQKRSYLTDYICGAGTDRACPGPAVPNVRNDNGDPSGGSAYLSITGTLVIPPRTRLPKVVPFRKADR